MALCPYVHQLLVKSDPGLTLAMTAGQPTRTIHIAQHHMCFNYMLYQLVVANPWILLFAILLNDTYPLTR